MTTTLKIVTAHQANYLPYLGFFEKISVADLFVLVDDTQFVKRGAFGWINRNRIWSQNGPLWLTVPVKTHDRYHQKISEVEIDNARPWGRKHLKSIEVSYRKTPGYADFYPKLQAIYEQPWTGLFGLNRTLISTILAHLDIRVPMMLSSDLGLSGTGSDYVLELSRKTGASHYISGMHGRDYLQVGDFAAQNIGLVFQDFECLPYPQCGAEAFTSHLSIIDAIFLTGVAGTRQLLAHGSRYALPQRPG